jgi:N-acetylneuraminate synthase/N,N'-diacetyllegionaminate synthase
MSTWEDVDRAVAASRDAAEVSLLHCVSLYPTPPDVTNLSVIPAMRERYRLPVGWSDHTIGVQSAVMAVALGATIIEKHITLDTSLPGPDHTASSDPEQFGALVSAVRLAETMLGTGEKRPSPGEQEVAKAARRSHHATRDLLAGQLLQPTDTELLRPATGAPASWDLVGRTLLSDVRKGDAIDPDLIAPDTQGRSDG